MARGADVTWRRVVCPAGFGYFIVGDAATVLDPASSHGTLRGMMSGIMAVHTILRIAKDGIPRQPAVTEYNRWLSGWFFHDVAKLKEIYLSHPSVFVRTKMVEW
jgi:flavin-dependent dehydrogenase